MTDDAGPLPSPPKGFPAPIRVALLAVIALAVALALALHRPPAPLDESAPPGEFSAMRALVHLRAIAAAPRPVGSPAHQRAREYIVQILRSHGLEAEVQSAPASAGTRSRPIPGGVVNNIVAVLPGRERGPALLLASHYDSVAGGPGASDDGAAVAAMLETLRALRTGPPLELKNDIVFLFTDAEELGLVGAQVFVAAHPLAGRIGAALNFEARGSRGPVFMFQTSPENGWLVGELAAVASPIAASSLAGELYRRMPNDTDFTVFLQKGIPGMNFAYIGGLRDYHTEGDTIENLDLGSLQQHGSYMLPLARRLGAANLADASSTKAPDAVYFNLIGHRFIHYSSRWVFPLLALAAATFLGASIHGARQKRIRPSSVVASLGLLVAILLVTALVIAGATMAVLALDPRFAPAAGHRHYDNGVYMVAFTALATALGAASYAYASRRWSPAELQAGALALWLLLAAAASIAMPGASYLFTWPLLFGSIGLWALVLSAPSSRAAAAVIAITAVPSITMIVPTIHAIYMAMTILLSAGVMVLVTLLLGLLAAPIAIALGRPRHESLAASASSASSS